jgi:hypothetical protein
MIGCSASVAGHGQPCSAFYRNGLILDLELWFILHPAPSPKIIQTSTRFAEWQRRKPESVAADTTYGDGKFLQWLADRNITPYIRTRDSIHRKRSPFFGPERFSYEPEHNRYICPAGQPLNYGGRVYRNRAFNYIGTRKRRGACSLRAQCTSAPFRSLNIHQCEAARQRARELASTEEFAKAQWQREKVEALFAELKNQIGLRRLRLRRLKFRA